MIFFGFEKNVFCDKINRMSSIIKHKCSRYIQFKINLKIQLELIKPHYGMKTNR